VREWYVFFFIYILEENESYFHTHTHIHTYTISQAIEEAEQIGSGDKFWGIDIAEKRRLERLRKQVQEKLCMWREMGAQMRVDDSIRQRNESSSFRRKYMSTFWRSPVLVQDEKKQHQNRRLQSSITTPNRNTQQRSIFVQKKKSNKSTSKRRRH
jgi:hypothetical protein